MSRVKAGGRALGTPNKTGLERIRENKSHLEKKLMQMNLNLMLQRALAGDMEAIESCLRLIAENKTPTKQSSKTKTARA